MHLIMFTVGIGLALAIGYYDISLQQTKSVNTKCEDDELFLTISYGSFPRMVAELMNGLEITECTLYIGRGRHSEGNHLQGAFVEFIFPERYRPMRTFINGFRSNKVAKSREMIAAIMGYASHSIKMDKFIELDDGRRVILMLPKEMPCNDNVRRWALMLDSKKYYNVIKTVNLYESQHLSLEVRAKRSEDGTIEMTQKLLVQKKEYLDFHKWLKEAKYELPDLASSNSGKLRFEEPISKTLIEIEPKRRGASRPVYIHRFIAGNSQERGKISLTITNESADRWIDRVQILEVYPWHVEVFLHTLQGLPDSASLKYVPARDRLRSATLQIELARIAPGETVHLVMEFQVKFLRYSEHEYDASRGIDIPAGIIDIHYAQPFPTTDNDPVVKEANAVKADRTYSENLLVMIPIPDFSMPFNVILITCIFMSLLFGSILNTMIRPFKLRKEADDGNIVIRKLGRLRELAVHLKDRFKRQA